MHIKFTYHANHRREWRKISVEKMKEVIRHPDSTRITEDGKIISMKRFPEGPLSAVYVMKGREYIIITIY
jgi:hypothetical protein